MADGIKMVWDLDRSASFGVKHPEIISSFSYKLNYPITPFDIGTQSDLKLFWECSEGHTWEATVGHRIRGDGCPRCNSRSDKPIYKNSLLGWCEEHSAFKFLIDEFNMGDNEIGPEEVYRSSNRKVSWVCSRCGCKFLMSPNWRTDGFINTCPFCAKGNSASKSEYIVYEMLSASYPGLSFERTKKFKSLRKMSYDIFIKELNLLIEYDGEAWHGEHRVNDDVKNRFAYENGYKLLRITEHKGDTYALLDKPNKVYYEIKFNYRVRKASEWLNLWMLIASFIKREFGVDHVKLTLDDVKGCIEKANGDITKQYRDNSFEAVYPFLVQFWSKENNVGPSNVSKKAFKKCKFTCPNGHTEEKYILNVTRHPDYYSCNECKRLGKPYIYRRKQKWHNQ